LSAAIAPATAELKEWTTLRARAALLRVRAYRTDAADGPVSYFTVTQSAAPRMHADLAALRARVEDLEMGPPT
jgi:hypothetical protein